MHVIRGAKVGEDSIVKDIKNAIAQIGTMFTPLTPMKYWDWRYFRDCIEIVIFGCLEKEFHDPHKQHLVEILKRIMKFATFNVPHEIQSGDVCGGTRPKSSGD